MSAIFGIVHWDGRPVGSADLARMDAALAAHGVDGGGTWIDASVGFGQRQSHITEEDQFERQPTLCSGGHGVLVADARINNRDDLARVWSLGSAEARGWPDSAFVSQALETWGPEGPAHLHGAFAFAHWDRRTETLLLARSPFCERPLFYHSSPRTFAFASMPKGLFALGVVDRVLDEPFLADFLAIERLDPGGSFYRGVRRVEAGHVLAVTKGGARSWPFWRPDRIRDLRLPNDDAYVEAFLEIYGRAVRDALRSTGPVGIMLSGGFDSSSVAAMAAPLLAADGRRLAAFTQVPPRGFSGPVSPARYADETPFVESLAARHDNIDLTLIRTGEGFFLEHIDQRHDATELPMRAVLNMAWWDVLMETARQHGVRVLLTGMFGNQTINWEGAGALSQLIGTGRWRDAFREARALSRVEGGGSAVRTLAVQGLLPWLPTWFYLGLQQLRSPFTRLPYPGEDGAVISPGFESAQRVRERGRAKGHDPRRRQRPDTRSERSRMLQRGGGVYDGYHAGCQARFGFETRDPTADLRLVEFCLSLPDEQYLRSGQGRWLVRRAMAGRIPAAILDNRQRGLQASDWCPRMQRHRHEMLAEIAGFERSDLARRAIDLPRLRRLVDALPTIDPTDGGAQVLYRGVLEFGLSAGRFIRWASRDVDRHA